MDEETIETVPAENNPFEEPGQPTITNQGPEATNLDNEQAEAALPLDNGITERQDFGNTGMGSVMVPVTNNVSEKFTENMGKWKEHLTEALAGKEKKKQKNILIILKLAELHEGVIKNEQVQKALRCTQLTAYRYLSALEKQGKLRRIGGHNTPTYKLN